MAKRASRRTSKAFVPLVFSILLSYSHSHPDIFHVRPSGSRVIQPYSCYDPATKEEGVCMFSWNCQRSNGTHLTYCMDRFYFGSCCKLPPGVYIATPPSITSNEVTEPKLKPRPTTRRTTTERSTTENQRWTSEQYSEKTSTKPPASPIASHTEFPPGLVTWRPLEETVSTSVPFKTKPTKLFSTKPLFGGTTLRPKTTDDPKSSSSTRRTKPTSLRPLTSTTPVSTRRRTRPTRPYGSTTGKRKRPTRPYPLRTTVSGGKPKPTRPVDGAESAIQSGTWSNILDKTSRPTFPTRKTTRTTPPTKRTTQQAIPTRKTTQSSLPTRRTTQSSLATRRTTQSSLPTRRTTQSSLPTRRTTQSPLPTRRTTHPAFTEATKVTAILNRRPTTAAPTTRRPLRPTVSEIITLPSTKPPIQHQTRIPPYTSKSTPAPGHFTPPKVEPTHEVITFPPFPGMTGKTTLKEAVVSTTPKVQRTTTLRPATTTTTTKATTISITEPPTTVPSTTTEKTTPGGDYTKESTADYTSTAEEILQTTDASTELASTTLNPHIALTTKIGEDTTEQRFTMTNTNNNLYGQTSVAFRPIQVLYDANGNEIVPDDQSEVSTFETTNHDDGLTSPMTTENLEISTLRDHSSMEFKTTKLSDSYSTMTSLSSEPTSYDSTSEIVSSSSPINSYQDEIVTQSSEDHTDFHVTTKQDKTTIYDYIQQTSTPGDNKNIFQVYETFEEEDISSSPIRDSYPSQDNEIDKQFTLFNHPSETTIFDEKHVTTSDLNDVTVTDTSKTYTPVIGCNKSQSLKTESWQEATENIFYQEASTESSAILDQYQDDDIYDMYDYYDEIIDGYDFKPDEHSTEKNSELYHEMAEIRNITVPPPLGTFEALVQKFTEAFDGQEDSQELQNITFAQNSSMDIGSFPGVTKVHPKPSPPTIPHDTTVVTKVTSSEQDKYSPKPYFSTIPFEMNFSSKTETIQQKESTQTINNVTIPYETTLDPIATTISLDEFGKTEYGVDNNNINAGTKTTIITIDNHRPPISISPDDRKTVESLTVSEISSTMSPIQEITTESLTTKDQNTFPTTKPYPTYFSTLQTQNEDVQEFYQESFNEDMSSEKETVLTTTQDQQTVKYPFPTVLMKHTTIYPQDEQATDFRQSTVGIQFTTEVKKRPTSSDTEESTKTDYTSDKTSQDTTLSFETAVYDTNRISTQTSPEVTNWHSTQTEIQENSVDLTSVSEDETSKESQFPVANEWTTISIEITSKADGITETERQTSATAEETTASTHISTHSTTKSPEEGTLGTETAPPPSSTSSDSTQTVDDSTTSVITTEATTFQPVTGVSTTEIDLSSSDYKEVCGRPMPGPVGRVVGGGNSYFGEWPWVVSLRQWKKNTFLHKCGATLLNEFWAITAAHCVENVPLTDILLRLGEYDISHEYEPLPFVERRVQIVASHPQFDRRTFEYDLALLRFYEPVTFQKNILPVCVPSGNNTYVGKYATVTGWGRLYEDGPLPDIIQEVALPVITNKVCENMYRQAGFVEDIPDIFICAGYGDGGKDSCEGDSGGPMVIQEDDGRWVLAGVISWGIGCALPNQPGVYTRITKFAEWINQIIIF